MHRIVRGSAAVLVSLLALSGTAVAFAAPAAAASPSDLVINEVEQDGASSDWIELYNTSADPVDASGLVLRDDKDPAAGDAAGNNYVLIPDGTVIEGHGFVAIDTGAMGLGKSGDAARLFTAADGIVPGTGANAIDSYVWSSDAVTTWGTCPDGGDDFVATTTPTRGAANDCSQPAEPTDPEEPTGPAAGIENLAINEVEQDGASSDWIELYNTGADPVDAAGLILRDDKTGSTFVTIPAGTTIAGHGFFAIDTGSMGLGKDGDAARLFESTSATTPISSYTWTAEVVTTWGSCPDGSGVFVETANPTKGAANDCGEPANEIDALKINEVEQDGSPDWIELYNTGTTSVDASGLVLRDNQNPAADDVAGNDYVLIPAGTVIPGHGFFTADTGSMGLGKGGDSARLFTAADGLLPGTGANALDSFTWTANADETFGRCPDGTGEFVDTEAPTRNAANSCPVPAGATDIVINEVESKGNAGGPDWVELYNRGDADVNVGGWLFRDNDPDDLAPLPAGKIVPAGGYLVLENTDDGGAGDFTFGLGNPDEVHLYLPDMTEVNSYSYTDHASTTYGRCPDGTGDFVTTFQATKGEANACSFVRINEIESNGDTSGDWVELVNGGDSPADVSGMVVRDNKDEDGYTIPAGTTLAAHAYYVVALDLAGAAKDAGGFGLGAPDSARLFATDGTTLLDSYSWTVHAPNTTYGRCGDTVGGFAETLSSTKGAANECSGEEVFGAWPGGENVTTVDVADSFGGDMSGLVYESTGDGSRGVLWGVNNKQGLYKLVWNGTAWVPAGGAWAGVRPLVYENGSGHVDAEGGTFGGASSADGFYIASERNNDDDEVSRPSILRYDVTDGSTGDLAATQEWNLASVIPGADALGANAGFEGIAWVPDSFLTGKGMKDESTGQAYDPANYGAHSNGLFFAGIEGTAKVYALALLDGGSAELIATLDPGMESLADVTFDAESGLLWVICDDACQGRSVAFEVAQDGPFDGAFRVTQRFENAAGMGDRLANEGMAIATDDLCVAGLKPVWYADDEETDGHALREGSIACAGGTDPGSDPGTDPGTDPVPPTEGTLTPGNAGEVSGPASTVAGETITLNVGTQYAGDRVDVWIFSTPTYLGAHTVSAAGTVTVTVPAGLAAGTHRIAVMAADGTVIGWFSLSVAGLAVTGVQSPVQFPLVLVVLAAGVMLVLMGRRRQLS